MGCVTTSTTTPALVVPAAGKPLSASNVQRRALRDDDVRIEIAFSGICHSDIHQARAEWGSAIFPMVPGHEIAGTVSAVGSAVTRYKVGDRVGVGCMVDSCGECEFCKDGEEQNCVQGTVMTYNGRGYDGEPTLGGYAQQIVVSERFVLRVPDRLGLDVAAPLLCAGITTYSPLKRWGAGPGRRVAVIGVGGLGHLGVKIAHAMGAEVVTLSRTSDKAHDALALGASRHVATSDAAEMEELRRSFDLILNTVSADLEMDAYLRLLRPHGALVNVGLPPSPYSVRPGLLVGGGRILTGSNIGGIAETQEMLEFCAEHGIGAQIEVIDGAQVNDAYDKVVAGQVRYRYVIDTATLTSGEPA